MSAIAEAGLSCLQAEMPIERRMRRITLPVYRFSQCQTRFCNVDTAIRQLIKTGGQGIQMDQGVVPAARAFNIPARLQRQHLATSPVAPVPFALIGPEIIGAAIEMQPEAAKTGIVRIQNGLQAAINTLRGESYARQRPARFVHFQR